MKEAGRGRDPPGTFLEWEGSDPVPSPTAPVPIEPQICQATCAVMKLSFDEEYRRAMNELGECPPRLLRELPPDLAPRPRAGFQPRWSWGSRDRQANKPA